MASRWSPLRSLSEQAEMRCRAGGWAVSSASRPWLIRPQARSETARETGGARSGGSGKGGTCRRRVQRKGVGGSDILGGGRVGELGPGFEGEIATSVVVRACRASRRRLECRALLVELENRWAWWEAAVVAVVAAAVDRAVGFREGVSI